MIRRPVKIVRRLSINLSNVFYFTALCFPRFLHLTEMRNERTPHSYFVRIFLIKLAGSSAFNQDTVTQSPVRVWRACSKTNDVNGNSKIATREAPRNVWEMIISPSMSLLISWRLTVDWDIAKIREADFKKYSACILGILIQESENFGTPTIDPSEHSE